MSKHMQLTVTVRPYYQKDLEGTYPNLERLLRHHDPVLAHGNPSLFDLVGQLSQIPTRCEGSQLSKVFSRHREKLRDLHERIREHIADWKLAQADRLLYEMEDVFDEMETDLR